MIVVKQYLLALKFRWIDNLFNKNYSTSWEIIENIQLSDNLFFVSYAQIVNQVI